MAGNARDEARDGAATLDESSFLDDDITLTPSPPPMRGTWVGTCVDPAHPTLRGRVRVQWEDVDGVARAHWLPTLASLAVREGDRVLLTAPSNHDEPVVTGVIDGFTPRPERPSRAGVSIALKPDEHLAITDAEGAALIEVRQGEGGPVVRVLHAATTVDLAGKLTLRADAIELGARHGDVRVEARGDVRVKGSVIRLNGT